MRRILRTLAEVDRKTDFTDYIIRKVSVNDDDYDEYDGNEDEDHHFGLVSLAFTLIGLWAVLSFLIICL